MIYPNPSSGMFTLRNAEAGSQLTVSNILGEIIYQTKVASAQVQVDLSNEAKGIYFFHLDDKNGFISSGKMIVE